MLSSSSQSILIFVILSTVLILLLITFISIILYRYQQKQNVYNKEIESLKASHENSLLKSQLEIQEQTLQNISREIHDNIGQKLTLAKLHLNTLNFNDGNSVFSQVTDSINMISEAINDLSDLSHSMSSEILLSNGLIKALEFEAAQIAKSGIYQVEFSTSGNTAFMNSDTELVLFRIVQEALNNIIKHAAASIINIHLNYGELTMTIEIRDNGKGFNINGTKPGTGLRNIKKRTALLNGKLHINSEINTGTEIKIELPIHEKKFSI